MNVERRVGSDVVVEMFLVTLKGSLSDDSCFNAAGEDGLINLVDALLSTHYLGRESFHTVVAPGQTGRSEVVERD